jgi:hypothetical protein
MITNWGVSETGSGDFSEAQWQEGSLQELGEHEYQLAMVEPGNVNEVVGGKICWNVYEITAVQTCGLWANSFNYLEHYLK